ncbi:antibiotic biosynthesis monooxygenase [Desulfopila sp. IMCC35006]|uniref:putative quinol monooxygenase n=1 Tax=Desulfopila sp. IMCC35006 TaxID=2569542 RepID=UPI0010AD8256|nr:antibiotic biosynthesis monooxygenase family protein [Desulfopila sp. IMCC35006]TKB25910.1 antibiotic biosynthesis monooxygenase [Desulfopila sp. IMCC35006]
MMFTLRTYMSVLPAKQKEVLLTLLSLLQQAEKKQGCVSYAIFSDIEDENVFNLISEWETRQCLDQHLRSNHFSILLGTKSLLSAPLKIRILADSDSEGSEALHDLRNIPCDK